MPQTLEMMDEVCSGMLYSFIVQLWCTNTFYPNPSRIIFNELQFHILLIMIIHDIIVGNHYRKR